MEIIQKSENLSKKQIYNMTRGPKVEKVQKSVGIHEFKGFVYYSDEKQDGTEIQVLSILIEGNKAIATNSQTFIPQFLEAYEMLDGDFTKFEVVQTSTKAGRTCYQFAVADDEDAIEESDDDEDEEDEEEF